MTARTYFEHEPTPQSGYAFRVRAALVAIAMCACGDNRVYPPGVLFTGTEDCCLPFTAGGGAVFFTIYSGSSRRPSILRIPSGGAGPSLLLDGGAIAPEPFGTLSALTSHDSEVVGSAVTDGQDNHFFSVPMAGGPRGGFPDRVAYTGGTISPYRIATDGIHAYGILHRLSAEYQQRPLHWVPEAGDWSFGDLALHAGSLYVAAPYAPIAPHGAFDSQLVRFDGDLPTRLAIVPDLPLSRIQVDDRYIYAGGKLGLARIDSADGTVTKLSDVPVHDLVDVDGTVYVLDDTPSVVRYDDGAPTTLVDLDDRDRYHELAIDGRRLFYAGASASNSGFIRYLDL